MDGTMTKDYGCLQLPLNIWHIWITKSGQSNRISLYPSATPLCGLSIEFGESVTIEGLSHWERFMDIRLCLHIIHPMCCVIGPAGPSSYMIFDERNERLREQIFMKYYIDSLSGLLLSKQPTGSMVSETDLMRGMSSHSKTATELQYELELRSPLTSKPAS